MLALCALGLTSRLSGLGGLGLCLRLDALRALLGLSVNSRRDGLLAGTLRRGASRALLPRSLMLRMEPDKTSRVRFGDAQPGSKGTFAGLKDRPRRCWSEIDLAAVRVL
jgi:hypothetical protein